MIFLRNKKILDLWFRWHAWRSYRFVAEVTFNPLTTNVPHHIEASQLICISNQLTGFCMMGNIGR